MIIENSGKIYRFKLDYNLGFGFAEFYDFTDEISMFDGRIVYVYNKIDKEEKKQYELTYIREKGVAIGPIRLHKSPNTKGLNSWKYLFKTDNFLIDKLPDTKELQGIEAKDDNWDNFKNLWYNSNYDKKYLPNYVDYEKVRHLETRIINSNLGVVKKATMKYLLDSCKKISEYYDLTEIGNKNLFVQLINTYYPLEKTKEFLKQIPTHKEKYGG